MNGSSTEYKKIVFIVVVVSALVSLITFIGLSMWTESSAGNEKLEEVEITSCLWSEDLDSAIISIKNTGETALEISQLRINDTLLSHEEWVCYPNNELESGDERHVYVSSSIITFKESSYYTFALTTESGKTFTHTFATPFTFEGTEQLEIQGVSWGGASGAADNTITVSVQNTGTVDLTVDKCKIGVGGTAVDITDVLVSQGDTASVVCTDVGWNSGITYDIYLITSTGKQFPYRATAPEGTTAGKMIKFDSASINAASDNVTIYVRNWGTEHVTIDTVYIDGANHTQCVDQTWPMSIPVDGVVEVTLSGGGLPDFRQGSTYRVKVTGPGVSWEESVKAS